jgi:hypothetical protein
MDIWLGESCKINYKLFLGMYLMISCYAGRKTGKNLSSNGR